MNCYGFKGGTGTASRRVQVGSRQYTVGVLMQANFGSRHELVVAGRYLGEVLREDNPLEDTDWLAPPGAGSCITVIATDAPLLPGQCKALATRVPLGLARTGTTGSHFSGDLFLAFSAAPGTSGMLDSLLASLQTDAAADELARLEFVPWGQIGPAVRGGRAVRRGGGAQRAGRQYHDDRPGRAPQSWVPGRAPARAARALGRLRAPCRPDLPSQPVEPRRRRSAACKSGGSACCAGLLSVAGVSISSTGSIAGHDTRSGETGSSGDDTSSMTPGPAQRRPDPFAPPFLISVPANGALRCEEVKVCVRSAARCRPGRRAVVGRPGAADGSRRAGLARGRGRRRRCRSRCRPTRCGRWNGCSRSMPPRGRRCWPGSRRSGGSRTTGGVGADVADLADPGHRPAPPAAAVGCDAAARRSSRRRARRWRRVRCRCRGRGRSPTGPTCSR